MSANSIPPLLLVGLLGLTFSTKANWRIPPPAAAGMHLRVPENASVLGWVDTPLEVEAGGYLLIGGWAVATTAGQHLAAVELYVDRRLVWRITDFQPRPDVAAAYSRPDFELSGWRCFLPTRGLQAGQHALDVRGVTTEGKAVSFFTKPMSILE